MSNTSNSDGWRLYPSAMIKPTTGTIARVPGSVLGALDAVRDKGVRGAATHLIIALPSATAAQRRRAVSLAGEAGLPVLTVPSADELRTGGDRVDRVRDIEPEDLLGREPVQLDEAGIAEVLQGKTVLMYMGTMS